MNGKNGALPFHIDQPTLHPFHGIYEIKSRWKIGGMEKPHGSVIITFNTMHNRTAASTCKIQKQNETEKLKKNRTPTLGFTLQKVICRTLMCAHPSFFLHTLVRTRVEIQKLPTINMRHE